MNQEKIGCFIAKKRKEHGLTQEALAGKLGVSFKSVSKWERGKCLPDHSLIMDLCNNLDISVSELMNGEERESDEATVELLGRIQAIERQRKILEGAFLVIIGIILTIASSYVEGSTFSDFVSGFLMGIGVGACAAGIILMLMRIIQENDK